jgi:putative nucleotidyltransferase with HDIG domain
VVVEAIGEQRRFWHVASIAWLVLLVTSAHWWTPRGGDYLHVTHVVLRKLYILPVVLAAGWFNLRGAIVTAGIVTMLYIPHVVLQWQGATRENVNQAGEIATLWITAGLSGVFIGREKAALARLAAAYRGTVKALVAALDAREHDTEQHSERVRAYGLRLADELRISTVDRQSLALGALLHDIGKIGVPDAILLKPGRLTKDEWRRMREHPDLGRRIVTSVPFLKDAIQVVHHHHERFDGSGYPEGLAGAEIPIGARIFAVADVFDALTSVRPYREPAAYVDARQEIESGAGTLFDPNVVVAFCRVPAEEWERIRERVRSAGTEGVASTALCSEAVPI